MCILTHPCPPVGTVTVVSPLELLRTKLQAQHVTYRELSTCVRTAVAQDGWRSLWLGWGPTTLRDVPFSGGDRDPWRGHRGEGAEPQGSTGGWSWLCHPRGFEPGSARAWTCCPGVAMVGVG